MKKYAIEPFNPSSKVKALSQIDDANSSVRSRLLANQTPTNLTKRFHETTETVYPFLEKKD